MPDPISCMTEPELERLLDQALSGDDMRLVWRIVDEIEERGRIVEI